MPTSIPAILLLYFPPFSLAPNLKLFAGYRGRAGASADPAVSGLSRLQALRTRLPGAAAPRRTRRRALRSPGRSVRGARQRAQRVEDPGGRGVVQTLEYQVSSSCYSYVFKFRTIVRGFDDVKFVSL